MKLTLEKSDFLGAVASSLCVIHCLATPFLFIAHSATISNGETSPIWWRNLDYIFLIISLFAVSRSTKNTSNSYIKKSLWISWSTLFLLLLNEKLKLISLPEIAIYITGITLAALHIYNLKFCKCKTPHCCPNNK